MRRCTTKLCDSQWHLCLVRFTGTVNHDRPLLAAWAIPSSNDHNPFSRTRENKDLRETSQLVLVLMSQSFRIERRSTSLALYYLLAELACCANRHAPASIRRTGFVSYGFVLVRVRVLRPRSEREGERERKSTNHEAHGSGSRKLTRTRTNTHPYDTEAIAPNALCFSAHTYPSRP